MLRRFSAVLGLQLLTFSLPPLVLIPTPTSAQITHNLEIIWQKSYVDGAAPDSLWGWGRSIASAGDVNGDGFDDIIVGANTVIPGWWLGKAHIFFGGSPMDTQPDVILTGAANGSSVINVSSIGDFNADGYDDVIVAQANPVSGLNGVKIFYGDSLMDSLPDLILETRPGYSFADAVAYAGDVNGDTYDDCITGDYSYNGNMGRATIFFGGPAADSLPDVTLNGNGTEGFGMSVGGGGDLNRDGLDDVVVGAWDNDEAASDAGKIYVYFGGDPMDTTSDVWMFGEGTGHHLGWFGVSVIEDTLDHDWVITGTPFYPYGFPSISPGKAYVLFGGSPMNGDPDVWMVGRTDTSSLGRRSAGAGNVKPDGYEDILAGAPSEYGNKGSTYLWFSNIPLDTVPDAGAEGEYPGQQPAWEVATAGDVDGGGVDEIMFSNYAAPISEHTVWIARPLVGVDEGIPHTRCRTTGIRLAQNRPNPFGAGGTNISFTVERGPCIVSLNIFDAVGRRVRTLLDKDPISGFRFPISLLWDGRDDEGTEVRSGIYFYRLTVNGGPLKVDRTRKLVLMR